MDTSKPTPRDLFALPVQYVVPLFQRAYVWNHQYHWEPLWEDIRDTAMRSLNSLNSGNPPLHFLGAIVLKQLRVRPGEPSRYLIVDGQQRLTTLQLALAGFRDALSEGSSQAHDNELNFIRTLTENPNLLPGQDSYKYKVVPFNDADVEAFEAIIGQRSAPDPDHPMAQCHAYYRKALADAMAKPDTEPHVASLTQAVGDLLQIVSVNLDANENEHLIFETLNARAEPLSEWDKARNLFFAEASARYDKAKEQRFYDQHIRQFDTGTERHRGRPSGRIAGRVRLARRSTGAIRRDIQTHVSMARAAKGSDGARSHRSALDRRIWNGWPSGCSQGTLDRTRDAAVMARPLAAARRIHHRPRGAGNGPSRLSAT